MYTTALAGLLLCVLSVLALPQPASAESIALLEQKSSLDKNIELATEVIAAAQASETKAEPKPDKPQTVKHTVVAGETLSKIAKQYDVTWQKVFYKNAELTDPDDIETGDVLAIPGPDEQLVKRPIPANEPEPVVEQNSASNPETSTGGTYRSSTGNTYTYGYCTWYVKNRRPGLPNGLGNAYEWVANARALGLATGSSPRVGAAGQRSNHVVYVEKVHTDGTVTVSEMNHVGWNIVSSRRVPASYFTYIY